MKFVTKAFNVGRIGNFTELPCRWSTVPLTTPMCLTYTCAGSVPHLTYDMLQHLEIQPRGSGLMLHPLPTIVDFSDAVKEMSSGLGQFVGITNHPFHISVQDPATATPSGYNVKKGASVWTHGGRKMLTPEDFMSIQRSFLPFSYQALCDSDTAVDCSKKRLIKSVNHSLDFLDQCLAFHAESEELKETLIYGTIQGGYDTFMRNMSATETAKRAVDGFVIDGFHLNGPDVRNIAFEKVKPILAEIVQCLPTDKPRMLNGCFHPRSVLEAIKCGVDIFDSSYPYILTECGEALHLPLNFEQASAYISTNGPTYSLEMDLKDDSFADNFFPLVKGCECYSCKNFTCAYIHHLLVTSELLGRVLLMLHNMFQFLEFFKVIRNSIQNQTFDKLEAALAVC